MDVKKVVIEKTNKLPLKNFIIVSFFVNIVCLILSFLSKIILPPEIPLFYGLPQNQEQITKSFYLFLPSGISLVLTVINTYISLSINNIYLKKILAMATFLLTILSTVTLIKIIFLVGKI